MLPLHPAITWGSSVWFMPLEYSFYGIGGAAGFLWGSYFWAGGLLIGGVLIGWLLRVAWQRRGCRAKATGGGGSDSLTDPHLRQQKIFQDLTSHSPVGYIQTDRQGNLCFASDEAARQLGFESGSQMLRELDDLRQLHASDYTFDTIIQALQAGREVRDYEVQVRCRDGSLRWTSISARRREMQDGGVLFEGFSFDVTDRVEAEQKLREAYDRLAIRVDLRGRQLIQEASERLQAEQVVFERLRYEKALTEISRCLLVGAQQQQAIDRALRIIQELTGVSRVYVLRNRQTSRGLTGVEHIHEVCDREVPPLKGHPLLEPFTYEEQAPQLMQRYLQQECMVGPIEELDLRAQELLRAMGVSAILTIPLFIDHQWYGTLGLDDISDPRQWSQEDIRLMQIVAQMLSACIQQRQTRDKLRQSQDRYRQVSELTSDIAYAFRFDESGHQRLDWLSGAFERITGYTWEEVERLGGYLVFIHPEDRERLKKREWRFMEKDLDISEYRILTKDGQTRWLRDHTRSIREEPGGRVTGIVGAAMDITEQKLAEQSIYDYQRRLQQLTDRLAETQEREQRRLATALHDHIGQTLSVTKLTLQRMRQKLDDQPRLVNQVVPLIDALDQAIQDIRSMTFELSPSILFQLGFDSAAQWLVERIEKQYGLQGHYVSDGLSHSLCDERRSFLFRALRELLINVVKHAQVTQADIRLARGPTTVSLSVSDTGVGFHPPGRGGYEGYGLFSLEERLDRLGGTLDVNSAPGKGTCVTVTLPLKPDQDKESEHADSGHDC